MRARSIPSRLLLCGALYGAVASCSDSPGGGPAVSITISTVAPPALVAYRDGLAGAWRAAAQTSATAFEAEVRGPYVVTVVCADPATGGALTAQLARTPDDERALEWACAAAAPVRSAVTGGMAQAGRVQIDDAVQTSATDGWGFTLRARDGTYDLLARTADRVALRRGIAVSGAIAVSPPLDLAQEGAPLVDVAFTATNAAPTETLTASVHLDRTAPGSPLSVYLGPPAMAKVAPDALLLPSDAQSVSVQATSGPALRALRRPFRVGGDTAYTLPPALGGVQWEATSGALAVSWTAAPDFDHLSLSAGGSSDGTRRQSILLDMSARFVADTGSARAALDTDIPGYQPEWRVDLARGHSRQLLAQRVVDREITTAWVSEQITGSAASVVGAAQAQALPLAAGRVAPP